MYRKLTVAKQAEICTSHLGVIFKINVWSLPLSSVLTCATLSRGKNSVSITVLRSMTCSCQFEISNFVSVTQILCFDERDGIIQAMLRNSFLAAKTGFRDPLLVMDSSSVSRGRD